MTDFTPPTPEELQYSNNPQWLREQADAFEAQAHALAERLRERAERVEYKLQHVEKSHLLGRLEKIEHQLERGEIKIDN